MSEIEELRQDNERLNEIIRQSTGAGIGDVYTWIDALERAEQSEALLNEARHYVALHISTDVHANELLNRIVRLTEEEQEDNSEPYSYHLEQVARTAWHPVSEPPVEEDADEAGLVAVLSPYRLFDLVPYQEVITGVWNDPDDKWARIRDVVLMPPEEQN